MAKSIPFLVASFLAILPLCFAVDYPVAITAPATPGVARFNKEIGDQYAATTAASASSFVWNVFQQNLADRKPTMKVGIFIDDIAGVAYTGADGIHVSAKYIQGYSGDVRREFTGVIFHEMTHVWQWNGNGQANPGLIEGMADYVRLRAGFVPSHWVKPGQGDRWDQGYDVTARFLEYCEGLKSGFVAQLNRKMRNGYNDSFFVDLLGKPVNQLFFEYKSKYN